METTYDGDSNNLPRILCLHGGGTSALIFSIQVRRLQDALRSQFHFVFVDAPFSSGAGPGVLPVFAECGPYFRWAIPESPDAEYEQQRVRQVLRTAIKKDGGEFVGVLGFSQGGRMAAGLLADIEENEPTGLPFWHFGVFLCASYPPLSMSSTRPPKSTRPQGEADSHGELRAPDPDEVIRIPSVHVRGTLDPHFEKGKRLARFFAEESKVEMEFVMGHHLPGAAGDSTSKKGATDEIAAAIVRAYRGEEGVGVQGGKILGIDGESVTGQMNA